FAHAAEIERGDLPLQRAAVALAAAPDEDTDEIAPSEPGQRLDQHAVAFPAREAARQHHHRRAIGEPPGAGKLHDARGVDAIGIELIEIDAAVDDAQPVVADAIERGGVGAD